MHKFVGNFYSFEFTGNLLEESEEDDYFEIETDFHVEKVLKV